MDKSQDDGILESAGNSRCDTPHLAFGYEPRLESLLITHFGDLVAARLLMLVLLISPVLRSQERAQQDVPGKFEPETFYMALMHRADPYNANNTGKFPGNEREYWQKLADKGDLAGSGPTTEVKDTLAAVMIFRATDAAAAKNIAENDPAVKSGLWRVELHPWLTQKGVLPNVKTYQPTSALFLGFLKRGAKFTNEDSPERQRIQQAHLANIRKLADTGKLVAAGPFTDDGDLRGIFVFNTATLEEANQLTTTDPAVQAGRLRIELYPWQVPAGAFPGVSNKKQ